MMFSNTSALRVVQYTPKVPVGITHKLPAKPTWYDSGKEPVKPSASKKVIGDTEQEKRRTAVGGLMFRNNSLFDVNPAGGMFNLATSPTTKSEAF